MQYYLFWKDLVQYEFDCCMMFFLKCFWGNSIRWNFCWFQNRRKMTFYFDQLNFSKFFNNLKSFNTFEPRRPVYSSTQRKQARTPVQFSTWFVMTFFCGNFSTVTLHILETFFKPGGASPPWTPRVSVDPKKTRPHTFKCLNIISHYFCLVIFQHLSSNSGKLF